MVTKSVRQKVLLDESPDSPFFGSDIEGPMLHSIPSDISLHSPITTATAATSAAAGSWADTPQIFMSERILPDNWVSHKFKGEILKDEDTASHDSFEETISSSSTSSVTMRKKVLVSEVVLMIHVSCLLIPRN